MIEKNDKSKKRIGYGVKVPFLSFQDVIELTKITANRGSESNTIDVLSRITNNSSSSSTFSKKVAALKIHGVFKIDKSNYSLTDLGKQIANPESFEQQAQSIIEAFLNQENLRKIWEYYKGKRLPQVEFLANSISNIIDIPTELKLIWAEYFIESAKFAGLLEEREQGFQVLSGYSPIKINEQSLESFDNQESETFENKNENISNSIVKDYLNLSNQAWGILSTKSISNNRKAIIAIPEELSQQDIDLLKILLKGIEVQLDGLKKLEEEF